MSSIAPVTKYLSYDISKTSSLKENIPWAHLCFLAQFDDRKCTILSEKDFNALKKARDEESCCSLFALCCDIPTQVDLVTNDIFWNLNVVFNSMAQYLTNHSQRYESGKIRTLPEKNEVLDAAKKIVVRCNNRELFTGLNHYFSLEASISLVNKIEEAAKNLILIESKNPLSTSLPLVPTFSLASAPSLSMSQYGSVQPLQNSVKEENIPQNQKDESASTLPIAKEEDLSHKEKSKTKS